MFKRRRNKNLSPEGAHKFMKQIQEKIKKFCQDNGLLSPPEHRVLDLMSEIGEVAKEILKMSDYGRKPLKVDDEAKEKISSELGDALYSLITVANNFDVDLEEVLDMVLEKYKKRLLKGGAGSENE